MNGIDALMNRLAQYDFDKVAGREFGEGYYQLKAALSDMVVKREVAKNEIFLKVDEENEDVYFIEKGLVCLCVGNGSEGRIPVLWIGKENNFFGDMFGHFSGRFRTNDYFVALEPTTLLTITHSQKDLLLEKFIKFNNYISAHQLLHLEEVQKYQSQLIFSDNEYKVNFLLAYHPALIGRAPLPYLASWLNMDPEVLRMLIAKRKRSGQRTRDKAQNQILDDALKGAKKKAGTAKKTAGKNPQKGKSNPKKQETLASRPTFQDKKLEHMTELGKLRLKMIDDELKKHDD